MSPELLWGVIGTLATMSAGGVLWWLRKHDAKLDDIPETYATKRELDKVANSIDGNLKEMRVDVRTQTELLQRILVEDRSANRGIRGSDD